MLHVLRAYVGISYCKTGNFNYTNFRVYVQVPALNINHPAGHLRPRPVNHDHYHVHARKCAVLRPPSRPLSW